MRIFKYLSPVWHVLVSYFRNYPPVAQSHGAEAPTEAAKHPRAAQRPASGAGYPLRAVTPRWYW